MKAGLTIVKRNRKIAILEGQIDEARIALGRARTPLHRDRLLLRIADCQAAIRALRESQKNSEKIAEKK